jgi:hypothetical protein
VAMLLQTLPVDDLTVEDVEIESVIRDLFARHFTQKENSTEEDTSNPSGADS